MATGGVMGADETNELNARREVQEELGIDMGVDEMERPGERKPHELLFVKAYKYETSNDNFFCNIYLMKYDGPLKLQESEVEAVEYWTLQEMYENLFTRDIKVTPESKLCFKELMKSEQVLFKLFGP